MNVDCLLDAVQALVADCDHPALRKIKNIDAFVNRCKLLFGYFKKGENLRRLLSHCISTETILGQLRYAKFNISPGFINLFFMTHLDPDVDSDLGY